MLSGHNQALVHACVLGFCRWMQWQGLYSHRGCWRSALRRSRSKMRRRSLEKIRFMIGVLAWRRLTTPTSTFLQTKEMWCLQVPSMAGVSGEISHFFTGDVSLIWERAAWPWSKMDTAFHYPFIQPSLHLLISAPLSQKTGTECPTRLSTRWCNWLRLMSVRAPDPLCDYRTMNERMFHKSSLSILSQWILFSSFNFKIPEVTLKSHLETFGWCCVLWHKRKCWYVASDCVF